MAEDQHEPQSPTPAQQEEERRLDKVARGARRIDETPILVKAVQRVRERLPGDRAVGDPLSTAANRPADLMARYLSEVSAWEQREYFGMF